MNKMSFVWTPGDLRCKQSRRLIKYGKIFRYCFERLAPSVCPFFWPVIDDIQQRFLPACVGGYSPRIPETKAPGVTQLYFFYHIECRKQVGKHSAHRIFIEFLKEIPIGTLGEGKKAVFILPNFSYLRDGYPFRAIFCNDPILHEVLIEYPKARNIFVSGKTISKGYRPFASA